jgi:hypothetical protein
VQRFHSSHDRRPLPRLNEAFRDHHQYRQVSNLCTPEPQLLESGVNVVVDPLLQGSRDQPEGPCHSTRGKEDRRGCSRRLRARGCLPLTLYAQLAHA